MTPWTKKMLLSMGWKEGDPIPGDIGPRLQQAIQEANAADPVHPMGDTPPEGSRVKLGKQVNFEDLSPEHQAELRAAIAEAHQTLEAQQNSPRAQAESAISPTLAPGVREAAVKGKIMEIEQRQTEAAPQAVLMGSAVEPSTGPDFRKNPDPPPAPADAPADSQPPPSVDDVVAAMPKHLQPPPGAKVVSTEGIAPFVTGQIPKPPRQQPAAVEPPAPEPEHDHDDDEGAGAELPIHRCPRCMFNLSHNFDTDPTEEDRLAFVATVLGTDRFRKTYKLMGDRFRVTFRSLEAAETDLIFRQMRLDQLKGEIIGDADYFGRLNVYRLSCMVENIADGNGTTIADVPPIMSIPYDDPEMGQPQVTRLTPMVEWFNKEVCRTESLRRIAANKHREFQRLLEALEAQTSDPSFWQEIG